MNAQVTIEALKGPNDKGRFLHRFTITREVPGGKAATQIEAWLSDAEIDEALGVAMRALTGNLDTTGLTPKPKKPRRDG